MKLKTSSPLSFLATSLDDYVQTKHNNQINQGCRKRRPLFRALCSLMKLVPATIILVSAFAALYFFRAIFGSFDWRWLSWTMSPYLILFAFTLYRALNRKETGIIPIAGVIVCLAGLIPYWNAYTSLGIDGQEALIFIFIPIYQAVGLFALSAIGYITIKSIKDAP